MDTATSRALAAEAWADAAELIDRQLSPLGLQAMAALDPQPGDVVLDIGCGSGQTLAQLGEHVGSQGLVVGIDIAARLLDVARRRTAPLGNVELVQADAQTVDLPTGRADAAFSRFGVMAFATPSRPSPTSAAC